MSYPRSCKDDGPFMYGGAPFWREHTQESKRNQKMDYTATHTTLWRDRVATGIMLLAAAGALISFIGSINAVAIAGPTTQVVEIWRMYGFVVFAGIYVLLAFWPRHYPGIWELAILDKAALAVTGLVLLSRGVEDAMTILIFDGSLTVITIAAYILVKGYANWSRLWTS